jgi:hypothetical protein
MTAKALRQVLIDKQSWQHGPLPCENTIGNILNRLGDRLRRVQKAAPVKRVRETGAIFAHGHWENHASDAREFLADFQKCQGHTERRSVVPRWAIARQRGHPSLGS